VSRVSGCENSAETVDVALRWQEMDRRAFQWSAPGMLSVLRMVAAFMFMANGAQKLFNYPPSPHPISHLPPLMLLAGVLECFGGLLVLVGLFTRPVAFVLAGEMATAYFMVLAPHGFGQYSTRANWPYSTALCSSTWR
jgi:uncharacterized membrane protein YphA (DoxX/SURF4 family)